MNGAAVGDLEQAGPIVVAERTVEVDRTVEAVEPGRRTAVGARRRRRRWRGPCRGVTSTVTRSSAIALRVAYIRNVIDVHAPSAGGEQVVRRRSGVEPADRVRLVGEEAVAADDDVVEERPLRRLGDDDLCRGGGRRGDAAGVVDVPRRPRRR